MGRERTSLTTHVLEAALTLRAAAARNKDPGNFSGEDLRKVLTTVNGVEAPSPNSWGPVIGFLSRHGLIQRNGGLKNMRTRSSHGRLTPTYSWVFDVA